MAEIETDTLETEEPAEGGGQPAKKKRKNSLVIFLIAGLLAAGGAAGAYFFLFADGAATAGESGGGGQGGGHGRGKASDVGIISPDVFIVNLADPDGTHFVKLSVRLVISPPEAAEKVRVSEVALIRIRDRIIGILCDYTSVELTAPDGKEELRAQIKETLSEIFEEDSLKEVLFSEFLIQ